MKKTFSLFLFVFIVIACSFIFTACSDKTEDVPTDYKNEEGRCMVSLPKEYDIFYESEIEGERRKFSEQKDILSNADTVNGEPKKDGYNYFSVLRNEPFRIITSMEVKQSKREEKQTLVYWQLNDTLYKDSDYDYYSENTYACADDTEINPVYYEYRTVGIVVFEVDDNDAPIAADNDIFDTNGNIKEQDGVYYLYGVYDFEPQREFWRTNLTLADFDVARTVVGCGNYNKDVYTVTVTIDGGNLFKRGKVIATELAKIDGHGYMLCNASHVIYESRTQIFSIGEHSLKTSFVNVNSDNG